MIMAVNHNLTHVLKDRVVQSFQLNASELLISFVDRSTMKVNIVESNSPPLREGVRIRQISEDQAKLLIECEDDSTLDVTLVDPGNSINIRDKANQVVSGIDLDSGGRVRKSTRVIKFLEPYCSRFGCLWI
jgi:hypothetical protein